MSNNTVKFNANVNIKQDLNIQGNLNVKGTTNTVNQETLTVKDNLIVTNAQGAATPYTGVVSLTGEGIYKLLPGHYGCNQNFNETLVSAWFSKYNYFNSFGSGWYRINFNFEGVSDATCSYIEVTIDNEGFVRVFSTVTQGYETFEGTFYASDMQQKFAISSIIIEEENQLLTKKALELLQILYNVEATTELEEAYASAVYNTADNEIQLGLGYITRTDTGVEFTFGNNENQALATRDKNMYSSCLVTWDDNAKKLISTGIECHEDGLHTGENFNFHNDRTGLFWPLESITNGDGENPQIELKVVDQNDGNDKGVLVITDKLTFNDKQLATLEDVENAKPNLKVLKDGSTIIGGVDADNYDATLPENQATPDGWLDFDSTVIEGDQNLAVGARNYTRGSYNTTSGLFNTVFSTEIQKNDDGTEKLDENGNPIPTPVNRSLAVGYMNQVRKSDSAAIGDRNVVTGGNSVALAYKNTITSDGAVAGGEYNTVNGESSIALGYKNNVDGIASFAGNGLNTVIGNYSAAFGENNTVNSYATFAAGKNNTVSGEASFAIGKSNTINGDTIFATGRDNNISGNYSSVFGKGNKVSKNYSTAFGSLNSVEGEASFAGNGNNTTTEGYAAVFGDHNTVGGYAGFASGQNNTITRQRGFVANNKNTVSGEDAAAFGTNNTAKGLSSFVGGRGNTAGVQMSFVMGSSNEVYAGKDSWGYDTGSGAVVFGNHNKTSEDWQLVTGRWNKEDGSALFIVGNGYDEGSRANAFQVMKNGTIKGGRSTQSTDDGLVLVTKNYIDKLEARIITLEATLSNVATTDELKEVVWEE